MQRAACPSSSRPLCQSEALAPEKTELAADLRARLLNDLQRDFPICESPWAELAARFACPESVLLDTLRALQSEGALLRIGPVFTPNRVGASCLAAFAVAEADLPRAVQIINAHAGVNHNYLREHRFNLWFVIHAADVAGREAALDALAEQVGAPLLRLPMSTGFHLDLGFDLRTGARHRHHETAVAEPLALSPFEQQAVARLQCGLPISTSPWRELCEGDEDAAEQLRAQTREWLASGVIRRFGLIVAHRSQGYVANAMCVFDVDDADCAAAGHWLAAQEGVHLCYARVRQLPEWRYNLFCMIHGRQRTETDARIAALVRAAPFAFRDHAVLYSREAYKQEGARNHPRAASHRHADVTTEHFDERNARLFNRLQHGIALCARPFSELAAELAAEQVTALGSGASPNWSEDAIIAQIQDWRARGVLSRFGPLFQIEKRGGAFTLCALHADDADYERIATQINADPAVAHNYARQHRLNMWFVLATERAEDTDAKLSELSALTGLRILAFPKQKEFAVGLFLPVGATGGQADSLRVHKGRALSASEARDPVDIHTPLCRSLFAASAAGLPLSRTPFADLAAKLSSDEATVIRLFQALQDDGSLRRIAAVPDHTRIGYRHNLMTVWEVDDAHIDAAGTALAALPFVSHCYQRPPHLPDWPYTLFAMVHAQTAADAERQVLQLRDTLGARCRQYDVLASTRVLKKTGLRLRANASD